MLKHNILTALVFFLGIGFSYSQSSVLEKPISINLKNTKTKDVLKQISKQTGFFFTYNPNAVKANNKINIYSENKPLKIVLSEIFPKHNFSFKIIQDHIVICKENENSNYQNLNKEFEKKHIEISGKVINKRTGFPIPFASVGIINSTKGGVTNKNGFFSLKIDSIFQDSIFFISNLGYKTIYISVSKMNSNDKEYQLIENFISIQEIVIRTNDPVILIKKAIENIQKNYIQKPSIQTAFYREGTKKKDKILTFSEAIIKIHKTPYRNTLKSDKIKIEKQRKIINTQMSDTVFLKLKNGLYSGLNIDIIKHPISFIDFIGMKDYNYRLIDIVTFGNKNAYVIEFFQKKSIEKTLFKGKIYIEIESMAIIATEFELNMKYSLNKPDFVVKKSRNLRINPISVKYLVNYRAIKEKYFLNHVRADIDFKIKKKRKLLSKKFNVFIETIIFDIDTLNVKPFEKKETFKKNQILIDTKYKYDERFWGSDSFIKPEKSVEDALKKISVKLYLLK